MTEKVFYFSHIGHIFWPLSLNGIRKVLKFPPVSRMDQSLPKFQRLNLWLVLTVPDTASYIRGWMQMVLTPNDLFSWNNKYSKYMVILSHIYTLTMGSLSNFKLCTLTYSVHAGNSEPWRGCLPCLPVVLPFHWDSRLAVSCVRS